MLSKFGYLIRTMARSYGSGRLGKLPYFMIIRLNRGEKHPLANFQGREPGRALVEPARIDCLKGVIP